MQYKPAPKPEIPQQGPEARPGSPLPFRQIEAIRGNGAFYEDLRFLSAYGRTIDGRLPEKTHNVLR